MQLVNRLQGGLPDTAAVTMWKDPSFDASHWPVMQLPGLWDNQQLGKELRKAGLVWFRKEVDLPHVGDADTSPFVTWDDR